MSKYQEILDSALSNRNDAQIKQSEVIKARNKRCIEQRDALIRSQDMKVNQMLNVFRPKVSKFSSN